VVDQALVSATVTNIFDEAGFKTPDLSIVSDEFVAELLGMEHKNLAVELLQKLLKDEIKHRSRTNIVQSRKLAEMLDDALRRYRNQVISVIDVLEELLELAKDTNAANARGEELKLEPYELAFYDALSQNHSAQEIMGVEKLRELAIVLVERIRKNASTTLGGARSRDRLEPQRKRPRSNESRSQTLAPAVWLSPRYGGFSDRVSA
jgi:type I restriction enzyme, R subunit